MQDMAVRLSGYLSKLSLPSLGVTDILEIALISFFIYQFMVDQVYPRLYSVEGNSDSTPFYFICICVENEYDPLDH